MNLKYILLIFLLHLCLWVSAQKNFEWDSVIRVDSNLSQKVIYSRAKLFLAQRYVSFKAVSQMADDQSATIVINAYHKVRPLAYSVASMLYELPGGYISYYLTVQCKDGRYKITINHCEHRGLTASQVNCGPLTLDAPLYGPMYPGGLKKQYWNEELKPDFIKAVNELLADLKDAITNSSKSDW